MTGLVSHQEVLFSLPAELLSIRFDTLDREAFMPEVLRAIRVAPRFPGLHVGLEALYRNHW
jgi:4-hydroxy-tetrahydrodipicolinate reductase